MILADGVFPKIPCVFYHLWDSFKDQYIYIHTYIHYIYTYIYIQSDLVVPNDSDVAKCADHSGYAATPSPNANVGVVHFSWKNSEVPTGNKNCSALWCFGVANSKVNPRAEHTVNKQDVENVKPTLLGYVMFKSNIFNILPKCEEAHCVEAFPVLTIMCGEVSQVEK